MKIQSPFKTLVHSCFGLFIFLALGACSNEDSDGDTSTTEPADQADQIEIAGTYNGRLKIENDQGNISADDPRRVTITKTAEGGLNIEIFKDHDYWDDLVFSATTTSDTEFNAEQVAWTGFTFDVAGSISGKELTMTFTNGAKGSYVGRK